MTMRIEWCKEWRCILVRNDINWITLDISPASALIQF